MRVAFVPGAYDGSYYYRCYLPATYNGWELPRGTVNTEENSWDRAFQLAMNADIVVFQRPNDLPRVQAMHLLKKAGKKIVFDNDDTYDPESGIPFERLSDKAIEAVKVMNANLVEALKIADMAIASTPFLAEEYSKVNKNTITLPNLVDPMDKFTKIENDTGRHRLGLIGSITTTDDFLVIEDEIRKWDNEGHVLVTFGINPDNIRKNKNTLKAKLYMLEFFESLKNIEYHPYVNVSNYLRTLNKLKLDLMVIPREDIYFNRAKSNCKFLEASLIQLPTVAQGFSDNLSPYQVNPKDKEYLELVTDNSTWYSTVNNLLLDKNKRDAMGKAAQQYVLKEYNAEDKAHLWEDAFRKLFYG